jgi:hypothetical protein
MLKSENRVSVSHYILYVSHADHSETLCHDMSIRCTQNSGSRVSLLLQSKSGMASSAPFICFVRCHGCAVHGPDLSGIAMIDRFAIVTLSPSGLKVAGRHCCVALRLVTAGV